MTKREVSKKTTSGESNPPKQMSEECRWLGVAEELLIGGDAAVARRVLLEKLGFKSLPPDNRLLVEMIRDALVERTQVVPPELMVGQEFLAFLRSVGTGKKVDPGPIGEVLGHQLVKRLKSERLVVELFTADSLLTPLQFWRGLEGRFFSAAGLVNLSKTEKAEVLSAYTIVLGQESRDPYVLMLEFIKSHNAISGQDPKQMLANCRMRLRVIEAVTGDVKSCCHYSPSIELRTTKLMAAQAYLAQLTAGVDEEDLSVSSRCLFHFVEQIWPLKEAISSAKVVELKEGESAHWPRIGLAQFGGRKEVAQLMKKIDLVSDLKRLVESRETIENVIRDPERARNSFRNLLDRGSKIWKARLEDVNGSDEALHTKAFLS